MPGTSTRALRTSTAYPSSAAPSCSSGGRRRGGTRLRAASLVVVLLLALSGPAWARSATHGAPPQQPPSTQAASHPSSVHWADLLERLLRWLSGADELEKDGLTSEPTNPDGTQPTSGDTSGTGSDPLNPQPEPPAEPGDERGSVIDPNGTTPT